jgi:hypothetical protein
MDLAKQQAKITPTNCNRQRQTCILVLSFLKDLNGEEKYIKSLEKWEIWEINNSTLVGIQSLAIPPPPH